MIHNKKSENWEIDNIRKRRKQNFTCLINLGMSC